MPLTLTGLEEDRASCCGPGPRKNWHGGRSEAGSLLPLVRYGGSAMFARGVERD